MITRPITIDNNRWYAQKAGRYFLLYDGKTGEHIKDFNGFDAMYKYIEMQRRLENEMRKAGVYTKENLATQYTGYTFDALPYHLREGAEMFWESGYDYSDPAFWDSYDDPQPDFIYAVLLYDEMQREGLEDEEN